MFKRGLHLFCGIILSASIFGATYTGEDIAKDKKITVDFRDADLVDVIRLIARNYNLNLIAGDNVKGKVTVSFINVPLDEALELILKINNYAYIKEGEIIRIISYDEAKKEFGIIPKKGVAAEEESGKIYKTYTLKNAEASKVQEKLKGLLKPDDKIVVDENSNKLFLYIEKSEDKLIKEIIQEVDIGDFQKSKKDVSDTGKITAVIPLNYIAPSAMASIIKDVYGKLDGEIKANDTINGIIVNAKKEDIKKIDEIVKKFDTPPLQVAIEVKVVELSDNNDKNSGVNWSYKYSTADSYDPTLALNGSTSDTGNNLKFGLIATGEFGVDISNLLKNSNGKILSSPNVTAVDGKKATIHIGQRISFTSKTTTATTGGTTAAAGTTETKVYTENVGIKLEVMPKILEDGLVNLTIKPEVSKVDKIETDGTLLIGARDAETNVVVKDNETFVIGGLIEEKETKTIVSVPILGDIPIIGELFKKEVKQTTKTNLIFFITPKILKTREFKSKVEFNFGEIDKEIKEAQIKKIIADEELLAKKKLISDEEKISLLRSKKELIRMYEMAGAFKKAYEEASALKEMGITDGDLDATYNRLKGGEGK